MSDSFLPEGYDGVPKPKSDYMNFEEGENRFRVLSPAVVGYVWFEDKDGGGTDVKRVKNPAKIPLNIVNHKDNRKRSKHFWAFVVYNYKDDSLQVLEIRQAKIQRAIEALFANPKWGDPRNYDLVITKKKTGARDVDVEYNVLPDPKTPVDKGVSQTYKDMGIDLEMLFHGKNPFNPEEVEVSPDDIPDDLGAH